MEGVLKSSSSDPELDSAIKDWEKSLKEMNETLDSHAEVMRITDDPTLTDEEREQMLKELGYGSGDDKEN